MGVGIDMRPWTSHALIALGLGAFSGFIAASYTAQYAGLVVPFYFIRPTLFTVIVVCLIAPFVEEQVKPLGLYLLKVTKVKLSVGKWAMLGAFAGLGFGLLENVLYTGAAAFGYGASAGLTILTLRGLLSLPTHMIASSFAGFGVGLWAETGNLWKFVKFLVLAMVIHGAYNFIAVVAGGGPE